VMGQRAEVARALRWSEREEERPLPGFTDVFWMQRASRRLVYQQCIVRRRRCLAQLPKPSMEFQ
jgi:hypothetical protein